MLDKLLLGRYLQGDSFIHRLDPRTKFLATFLFIIIVFLANNWLTYFILAIFTMIALLASKIPMSFFWNGVKPLLWVILFTVVLQMVFTTGGDVYVEWAFIKITSYGVINAIFIFLRFMFIIFISTLMTLTTPPLQIADAMESIMKPLGKIGVPVHEIALMLSIALRFVPTLMDEAQKIMNAQRARGVDFGEGNLLKRIRSFIPILIPLFASSFKRADALAIAMEARGYKGGEGRTRYRSLQWRLKDTLALLVILCLMLFVFYLKNG